MALPGKSCTQKRGLINNLSATTSKGYSRHCWLRTLPQASLVPAGWSLSGNGSSTAGGSPPNPAGSHWLREQTTA